MRPCIECHTLEAFAAVCAALAKAGVIFSADSSILAIFVEY